MKALSIRQPWAWLIAQGYKDIENRRWRTNYRGPILIHAAKLPDEEFVLLFAELLAALPVPEQLDCGGIVGRVDIVECVDAADGNPWFVGPFGFVLSGARPLPFVRWPGKLGLFEVPDEVVGESS